MKEILSKKSVRYLASTIGLAACVSCSGGSTEAASVPVDSDDAGITRSVEYAADGSRLIRIEGYLNDRYDKFPSFIYEFCDGGDLVEQSLGEKGYPAGSIERSVGHAACTDGRLTESDFMQSPVS